MSLPALHYPFDKTLPATGEVMDVAPGIRWLRMPLPFALDHINLWLVEDQGGWTAIDTGIALDPVKAAWESILARHTLVRQIVTHGHPDHVGLAAWLEQRTGAPLWITFGEFALTQMLAHQIDGYGIPAMLAFFRQHGLDEDRLEALRQRGNSYRRGVPEIPVTYRRLFHGQKITIGGHEWEVIVGHGHSAEHASLYCADRKVLISGDMLLPRISTNISVFAAYPDSNPLAWFLDSIQDFRRLPEDTLVLPSHGHPFRGIHPRITQLEDHHRDRCADLLAACRQGARTAAELLPVLFPREITDAHQTMFAMGEAAAHLNYMEAARQVRAAREENGIIRYQAIT